MLCTAEAACCAAHSVRSVSHRAAAPPFAAAQIAPPTASAISHSAQAFGTNDSLPFAQFGPAAQLNVVPPIGFVSHQDTYLRLNAAPAVQDDFVQPAPLTVRGPLHLAQTVSTIGTSSHSAQFDSIAQFHGAVSAPHTDATAGVPYQDAVAPCTINHVSPRSASSNQVTPAYLSDVF